MLWSNYFNFNIYYSIASQKNSILILLIFDCLQFVYHRISFCRASKSPDVVCGDTSQAGKLCRQTGTLLGISCRNNRASASHSHSSAEMPLQLWVFYGRKHIIQVYVQYPRHWVFTSEALFVLFQTVDLRRPCVWMDDKKVSTSLMDSCKYSLQFPKGSIIRWQGYFQSESF